MRKVLSPGQLIGGYRVVRQVGEGGTGTVYVAVPEGQKGPQVAIKVLQGAHGGHPGLAARLRREATASAAIIHPGIVRILDYLPLDEDHACLVMEHLEGESMQARLDCEGALPAAEAARIHRLVAEALSAAHAIGIVHRDLKPANVMLARGGSVHVLDFGIAKAGADFTQIGTADGVDFLGTPAFMAPEQFMAPSQVSGAADVYSLGVMLYRAVGGALPFQVADPGRAQAVLHYYRMHQDHVPPPLPADVPAPVRELVGRMLAKKPADRPTMDEVARLLLRMQGLTRGRTAAPVKGSVSLPTLPISAPVEVMPSVVMMTPPPPQGPLRLLLLILAGAIVLAAGIGLFLSHRR